PHLRPELTGNIPMPQAAKHPSPVTATFLARRLRRLRPRQRSDVGSPHVDTRVRRPSRVAHEWWREPPATSVASGLKEGQEIRRSVTANSREVLQREPIGSPTCLCGRGGTRALLGCASLLPHHCSFQRLQLKLYRTLTWPAIVRTLLMRLPCDELLCGS